MIICEAEDSMSANEKKVLHLMPYLNTDNIPIFVLKSLLPNTLSRKEKAILIDHFLRTLDKYSLISHITGLDEHRVVAAHRFTLMIVKASSTSCKRNGHLKELLNFFMCYIDLDARLLEVIHRNQSSRHLPSDKTFNSYTTLDEYLNGSDAVQEHCQSIFNILIEKGKHISQEFVDEFIRYKYRNSRSISLLCEYGNIHIEDVHTNQLVKEIVGLLQSKNLIMESEYISTTFLVELMIRILYNSSKNNWLVEISKASFTTHERGKLRKHLSSTHFPVTPDSLLEHQMAHCLTKSLQQYLSNLPKHDTRVVSSENTIQSFCPVFSPVTNRSGILYMLRSFSDPDRLPPLLNEAIQLLDSLDSNIEGTGFTEFGVVKRIGDSSLFHSVMIERIKMECYEKMFKLECPDTSMKDDTSNKESLDDLFILEGGNDNLQTMTIQNIDDSTEGDDILTIDKTGNTSDVQEDVDLDSTYKTGHELPDDNENMERPDTTGIITAFTGEDLEATCITVNRLPLENEHLLKALAIAKHLEEKIDDLTSWKALSGIHLKIAKVFKHTNTEENIIKAKHHYKKAYDREYESNNTRLTRFHLKAIVHYAECCLQFPIEEDLKKARTLALAMKFRFRLVETGSLFDEVIEDIDNCLNKLSQNQHPDCALNTKEKPKVDTKSTQTDTLTNETNWLLKELKRRRDRLIQNQSTLLEQYENLKCDMEMVNREIHSVEEEITNIEERLDIEPYLS
ncbi:unnamed protein product [Mytilus edulis]|uniref:DED domain-containing protein n=1 Tax=Mytilus edulis TaxID=6550 RepID=A0A8S3TIJ4_MYTED|nr:unnamed protein product [Mytilus edulis]